MTRLPSPPSTMNSANSTKNDPSSSRGIVTKEALETLIGHLEVWALIFGAIVVIGVAGESIFGVRIWWNSRKLQAIQRTENLKLQTTLATLQKEVANADARIAEANR